MATDNYTSNINVNVNTGDSLAELRKLQAGLANFNQAVVKGNRAAELSQDALNTRLIQQINSIKGLSAVQTKIIGSTEQFTTALERNKLSLREYGRYSAAGFLEGDLARSLTKRTGLLQNAFKQEREILKRAYEDRVRLLQSQWIRLGRPGVSAEGMGIRITPTELANMDDFATKTQLAAQRMQILNATVKQGATQLINWGKNTQWAGRQLMVGLTVPLTMLGAVAARTFKELEMETIRFRRVYGNLFTDQAETDQAVQNIMRLGKEYLKFGITVKDTMKMAADAAAMGKVGADLEAQVAQATKLAVLGGVEQSQALETTISLTNAFGIAADELSSKIDFLNAVENQTVTSIEDLTIAVPKAGPVIKQLGGTVEDLAFFLTAMREGGINASEGANALKSGLASLINPTNKAKEMLAGFGINIDAIVEGNKGDLKATVIGFAQALDTLAPLERARAIEQLFGKFQFARLSTLFQNVTKDGTQASNVLKLAGASVEELAILSERELGKVEESVAVKFQKAVEEVKLTLLPIGKLILESLVPVLNVIGKGVEWFNELGDGTKKFILIFATAFPAVLMSIGLFGNLVGNLIKGIWGLNMIFRKVGNQSSILGSSFNYVTNQEIENLSMTRSLVLGHSNLIEVFNVEASAVGRLTAAYEANALAARTMATANPGFFVGGKAGAKVAVSKLPKKLKDGTSNVRYYKKGTDTVPAMLTPGEAVIPAGAAQDPANKPAIQAMIAGEKVQYFDSGNPGVSQSSTLTPAQKRQNRAAQTYIVRNAEEEARYQKRSQAAKRGAETKRLNAIKAETKATEEAAKQKDLMAKEQKKARVSKVAGRVGGGLGIASVAAYATGNVGAGNALMGASMAAQLAPALTNPYVAGAVAVGAMVAGIYVLNKVMAGRARKEEQFVRSVTANTDQMRRVSEITKTVGASQIMAERRRRGQFQDYNTARDRQGRPFGSQFLSSDIGKEVYKAFTTNKDIYGTKKAAQQFAVQLAAYISDGIMTAEQANSIADQIAVNLGDVTIRTNIEGVLRTLIGPNGEDLTKDPLTTRIKLIRANQAEASRLAADEGFQSLADRAKKEDTWYQTESTLRLRAGAAQMAGYAASATEFAQAQLDSLIIYNDEQRKILEDTLKITTNLEERLKIEQQLVDLKQTQAYQEKQLQAEVYKTLETSMQQFKTVQDTSPDLPLFRTKGKQEDAYFDAIKGKIKDIYKGTEFETSGNVLLDKLAKLSDSRQFAKAGFTSGTEAQDFEVNMQLLLANKIATPDQVTQFMSMFDGNLKEGQAALDLSIKTHGAGKTFELQSMLGNITGEGSEQLKQDLFVEITALPTEDFNKAAKALAVMTELDGNEVNMNVMLTGLKKEGGLDEFYNTLAKIEEIDFTQNKKQIELDLKESGMPEGGIKTIMDNWSYYASLPPDIRKEALQKFMTIYTFRTNFEDPEAKAAWIKEQADEAALKAGAKGSREYNIVYEYQYSALSNMTNDQLVQKQTQDYIGDVNNLIPTTAAGGGGDGGKTQVSVLDELTKKLRDVRKNQIKVTEGWDASMKALDKLFGGKKKINIFSGIEQDLSRLGAKGNLIDLVIGMDPKDYEKRKNQLFKFDNKGNIIGLKRDAKTIQQALNSIVAGDFVAGMVREKSELKDQATAFKKLTSAGVGVADAYEVISNKALASAIANEKNSKSVEKLIELYKKQAEIKKLAEAKQNVALDTEAYQQLQDARKNIAEQAKKESWSWLQADAILNDDNLLALAKLNKFGSDDFKNRLQQVLNSIEFKESIFNKGFDNAMERFNTMENAIEINFQIKTLEDQDIVEKAQDKIAAIQYQIDDYEAQLVGIEEQEKLINEEYDKASKALDYIADANDQINRSKKSQLSIADALTQGDISAAARAAEEARAQRSSDAISNQRKALDLAREARLAAVQGKNGLTRKEIEAEIEKLRKSIFTIEEEELEVAQERIRLLEVEKRERTESLTVLGRSKLEWASIKSGIDLAKTSSAEYMQAVQAALDVVEDIKTYWNDLNGKIITTTHEIITKYKYENDGLLTTTAPVSTTTAVVATTPTGCPAGTILVDGKCMPINAGVPLTNAPIVITNPPTTNPPTTNPPTTIASCPPGTTLVNGKCEPVNAGVPITNAPVVTIKPTVQQPNEVAGYSTPIITIAPKQPNEVPGYSAPIVTIAPKQPNEVPGYSAPIITIAPVVTTKAPFEQPNTTPIYSPVIVTNAPVVTTKATVQQPNTTPIYSPVIVTNAPVVTTKAPVITDAPVVTTKATVQQPNTTPIYSPVVITTKASSGGGGGGGSGNMMLAKGGMVKPLYRAMGGALGFINGAFAKGTDTVPAMLSPGEFIVSKYAVENYGLDRLKAINDGMDYDSGSVYNYNLNINVESESDPEEIARVVMMQIKRIDSQRIKGQRY